MMATWERNYVTVTAVTQSPIALKDQRGSMLFPSGLYSILIRAV